MTCTYCIQENLVDYVSQHWEDELRHIIEFGQIPLDQLKKLISEKEYEESLA